MEPYWSDGQVTLHLGDCVEVLAAMEPASIDAVCTDPPYGLEFMGRDWDSFKPARARLRTRADGRTNPAEGASIVTTPESYTAGQPFQEWCQRWASECLRVLKPGGHLLAFGGTRTWHRLACAVEDAGFEIRDSTADLTGREAPGLLWLYGSGFPKSMDVSKAIDKRRDWTALSALQAKVRAARAALGISQSEAARRCGLIGADESLGGGGFMWFETGMRLPTPQQYPRLKAALGLDDECDRAFEEAEREVTGTVAEWSNRTNYALTSRDGLRRDIPATEAARDWHGWGTALKPAWEPIVVGRKALPGTVAGNVLQYGVGALNIDGCRIGAGQDYRDKCASVVGLDSNRNGDAYGEWTGERADSAHPAGRWPPNVLLGPEAAAELDRQSGATVSRAGKPRSSSAPGDGYGMTHTGAEYDDRGGASRFFPVFRYEAKAGSAERPRGEDGTAHPTVKPVDLMAWLVRLVTPPGGLVLDPFAGSGTTAEACIVEGFRCVLVEKDPAYAELIRTRLRKDIQPTMFGAAS